MSFDLYVWKRPLVDDEDEALELVEGDDSAFDASADVEWIYDEVRRRWPAESSDEAEADAVRSDWAVTIEPSDRLVAMSFTWSVPGEVLDEVVRLARERDLVLYDPQGPSFHSPPSLDPPPPGRRDPAVLRNMLGTLVGGVAIAAVVWFLPVPVLDWILVVIGAFFAVLAVVGLVIWLRE